MPIESVTYAQLHLPNMLECVPEERIFNVDESGLLYKQKPKYRLGTEALRGKAGKKDESAKEHIIVNFALNATGMIKTPSPGDQQVEAAKMLPCEAQWRRDLGP